MFMKLKMITCKQQRHYKAFHLIPDIGKKLTDIYNVTYQECSAISDEYKLQVYIRIVKLFLEEDEAVQAESYLNRAALLIPNSNDTLLNLTFKLSQARILDAKRKFLEACSKYHELSYVGDIPEDERVLCL